MKRGVFIFLFFLFLFLFAGIKVWQHFSFEVFYIQPLNKSQCITVFNGYYNYIIPGKHFSFTSEKNYIKVELGESRIYKIISVCWNDSVGWNMVIPESSMICNHLDSTLYVFSTDFPRYPENSNFNECGKFDYITAPYNEAMTSGTGSSNIYYEYGKSVWIWKK